MTLSKTFHALRIVFASFLPLALLVVDASASPSVNSTFAQIKEFLGRDFVGGKKPEVVGIKMIKEFKDPSSGYYYYKHRVTVRRSGGDTDGFFVIYHPKTWGEAANQIFKLRPNVREAWALKLFVFGYANAFPPVRAQYYYLIGIRDANKVYHISTGYSNRSRAGEKRFTEDLSLGLLPGKYTLELDGEVALAGHPIVNMWNMWDWFSFGKDIYKREFWSALGLSSSLLEWAIRKEFARTTVKHDFTVMAKMPNVTKMHYITARNELLGRRLRVRITGDRHCSPSKSQLVLSQSERPGKGLKANSLVVIRVCARAAPPHPTPVPTPPPSNARYYIFSCTNGGNSLFLSTPQGIQNIKLCDVDGAGNNCTITATFSAALAGPYSSLAAAQQALCTFLSGKHYNKLVPWGPWVKWGGSEYRCFESECESALSSYCPTLPYY